MAALQFVEQPSYAALLLRKSFADLSQPDALIPRSMQWLGGKAKWSSQRHEWTFPSNATLRFGYLDVASDIYQYQSSAFQFIGWDELTQFSEPSYRYLFSRLRRNVSTGNIPLRMRGATNPGGRGATWVKQRFLVEGRSHGRYFVPAKLDDNPYLDRESYINSLMQLDPVTRKQLLDGDWSVRSEGSLFDRAWFEIVDRAPEELNRWVRFWDLAATEPEQGKDPDWTSGCKIGCFRGVWYIADVQRFRATPMGVEARIQQTAKMDGPGVAIGMEQEPGASGKGMIDHYQRYILSGFDFQGIPSLRDKILRAGPLSSAAQAQNVKLIQGPWINDFWDELESFPGGEHDDQVDAATGAFNMLATISNVQASNVDTGMAKGYQQYNRQAF